MSDSPARRPAHRGGHTFFRVVIPAHDEERVIGKLVSDLQNQQYPSNSYQVYVLADRCTDATARVAATAGARVVERSAGPDGKGALLDWYLKDHPVADDEGLVVLDADNRVEEDFLSLLSAAVEGGTAVIQASVLPSNLGASPIATAAGLGDWMIREMVYKKAAARGWSVTLGGTGFCVTGSALSAVGGWGDSLTEDLDFTVRLLLAGQAVRYLPQARVWDEKPATLKTAVGQRRRWAQGRTGVRKSRAGKLWKASVAERSASKMAMALRLILPGRSFRLLITVALGVASAVWGWAFPFSWPVWTGLAVWLGGRPLWVLWRVREIRPHLHWYPLTLIWGFVWVWVRLGPRRSGWYHTPHRGNFSRG